MKGTICKKTLLDVKECLTNLDSSEISNLVIEFQDTIKKAKEKRRITFIDTELEKQDSTFNDLLDHLKKKIMIIYQNLLKNII